MASHGTDQLIVQRLLATKELRKAQKAIITSGIFIIFQFALFLFIGVLLYLFYGSLNMKSDEIFTYFIINEVPSGFKGLIIAGLFAAAISTIAGSIISLSSSTVMDLGKLFLGKDNVKLLNSKYFYKGVTFFWTIVLIWISLFFLSASKSAVEIGLSVASFTYGGLLGAFLLGIISKKAKQEDALAAFAASIFGMIAVVSLKLVAWTWFTLVGVSISMIVGITATKIED
jgi:Na+/proline symporter